MLFFRASQRPQRVAGKQNAKSKKKKENEAFLHLNPLHVHRNESLVYFLTTPWRKAHCIRYNSCCCFFICLYFSLSVSSNKYKAPQRDPPPPLHPRESLYIESHDHFTSCSVHLNSVWSEIGGFWVCFIGAFNVVRNVYRPSVEKSENEVVQTARDGCVIFFNLVRRVLWVPASRREILGRAASV